MLKLSRRVEYGIMAVQYISQKQGASVCTAKEIAEAHEISFDLLSKVLQKLTRSGIIASQQGIYGGYVLARKAEDISIHQIITSIEDNDPMIMPCADTATECELERLCGIKNPLMRIQAKISNVFQTMTVAEIS